MRLAPLSRIPSKTLRTAIAFASAIALGGLIGLAAAPANAQTYDWGGTDQYGGGRQTVSFPSNYSKDQIVVSFGDRRLYFVTGRGRALSYPIAVPREDARWEGKTSVSMKKENPAWRPTPSMLRDNPRLPSWVPGGHPMNPLGVRALYLGTSTYRIHGTDAPWTIGTAASSGCIRMYNKDVLDLYPRVSVGASVLVTWRRFTNTRYTQYDDGSSYRYSRHR